MAYESQVITCHTVEAYENGILNNILHFYFCVCLLSLNGLLWKGPLFKTKPKIHLYKNEEAKNTKWAQNVIG